MKARLLKMTFTNALPCLLILMMGLETAIASPTTPSKLEEVNQARTVLTVLVEPRDASPEERNILFEARPWIARTILVLRNPELSTQKLKELLKWNGAEDPIHSPGVQPGKPTLSKDSYVIMRQDKWRVTPGGDVSVDFVWVHSNNRDAPYFIETQLYREDQGVWYLHRQSRKRIETCHKYPYCVEDIK